MKTSLSLECWRCAQAPGDLHIFWSCPVIGVYWNQITSVIQGIVGIEPTPEVCLLGLVKELVPRVAESTLLGLLFYTRKIITLLEKKLAPPSLSMENACQCIIPL